MSAELFAHKIDVSRETLERLSAYADLLNRWNAKINLVGKSTLEDIWRRHFLDSAQFVSEGKLEGGKWLDLGSGGGFPGAVVAILADGWGHPLDMVLVESDKRKAAFLTTVSRATGVHMTVLSERIENLPQQSAQVVSARAFAPLEKLFSYAYPHMSAGARIVAAKGANVQDEISAARKKWRFNLESRSSMTNEEAVILRIGDLERV